MSSSWFSNRARGLSPGRWYLLWAFAPVIAWRLSVPEKPTEKRRLTPKEIRSLRLIARRTWRFFETFVTDDEHALPPDNFQEDPSPVVAHRTSPTNMGLYLLSTMVARDFGWIGTLDMVSRLEATLDTMASLRRHNGHFFNWYDTGDLRPLEPHYISTVDSGNLAGHLIALSQGCRDLMHASPLGPRVFDGLRDALQPVLDAFDKAGFHPRADTVTASQTQEVLDALSAALTDTPTSLPEWKEWFEGVQTPAENLVDITRTVSRSVDGESGSEALDWSRAVFDTVQSHARDFAMVTQEPDAPDVAALEHRLAALALRAEQMAEGMDFRFLFDPRGNCFRLVFAWPIIHTTPVATICWRRKRG